MQCIHGDKILDLSDQHLKIITVMRAEAQLVQDMLATLLSIVILSEIRQMVMVVL